MILSLALQFLSAMQDDNPTTLTSLLRKSQALMLANSDGTEPPPPSEDGTSKQDPLIEALAILEQIQEEIQRASIFSKNETLVDIQTSSIPLLSVEYQLAKACLQLRTISSVSRNNNVRKAIELFYLFLHRCDGFEGILEPEAQDQYQQILSHNEQLEETEDDAYQNPLPSPSRDDKIARFRRCKEIKQHISRVNAQLNQRKRLDLEDHEDLDGHDQDSLLRSLHLHQLNEFALDAIEELYSSNLELQMLQMAVKMEKDREAMNKHRSMGCPSGGDSSNNDSMRMQGRRPINDPNRKMKMTQVLQDPNTGQLLFKKQEIQSTLFRPSWNQPTMSLEELAEKEVKDAMEREARQKVSEQNSKNAPRRYEYLVRDGLEDNADLVDASAKLDQEWDDWKDENPKGSGNKMGDVGDRNF